MGNILCNSSAEPDVDVASELIELRKTMMKLEERIAAQHELLLSLPTVKQVQEQFLDEKATENRADRPDQPTTKEKLHSLSKAWLDHIPFIDPNDPSYVKIEYQIPARFSNPFRGEQYSFPSRRVEIGREDEDENWTQLGSIEDDLDFIFFVMGTMTIGDDAKRVIGLLDSGAKGVAVPDDLVPPSYGDLGEIDVTHAGGQIRSRKVVVTLRPEYYITDTVVCAMQDEECQHGFSRPICIAAHTYAGKEIGLLSATEVLRSERGEFQEVLEEQIEVLPMILVGSYAMRLWGLSLDFRMRKIQFAPGVLEDERAAMFSYCDLTNEEQAVDKQRLDYFRRRLAVATESSTN